MLYIYIYIINIHHKWYFTSPRRKKQSWQILVSVDAYIWPVSWKFDPLALNGSPKHHRTRGGSLVLLLFVCLCVLKKNLGRICKFTLPNKLSLSLGFRSITEFGTLWQSRTQFNWISYRRIIIRQANIRCRFKARMMIFTCPRQYKSIWLLRLFSLHHKKRFNDPFYFVFYCLYLTGYDVL